MKHGSGAASSIRACRSAEWLNVTRISRIIRVQMCLESHLKLLYYAQNCIDIIKLLNKHRKRSITRQCVAIKPPCRPEIRFKNSHLPTNASSTEALTLISSSNRGYIETRGINFTSLHAASISLIRYITHVTQAACMKNRKENSSTGNGEGVGVSGLTCI